jgi:hypothetical protein
MNYRIIVFLTFVVLSKLSHAQLAIGTPEIVANQDPWGNVRPRVTLDADNNPIVIWTNLDSMSVFMSKHNGTSFSSPTRMNPPNVHVVSYDWAGPDVASNGSNAYLLYQTHGNDIHGPIYMNQSFDNGNSWEDTLRVDSPLANQESWLPALGIDMETGSPMAAYMKSVNGNGHEWYVTRNNGNNVFTEEGIVSGGTSGNACDCCPASFATHANQQALIFRNNNSNLRDIHAVWEYGNIEQSTNDVDIDTTDWSVSACPASAPSAFWQGTKLITAFRSNYENRPRVFVSSFDITTNELVTKQPYPQNSTAQQNYPIIDGSGNVWGLVWEVSAIFILHTPQQESKVWVLMLSTSLKICSAFNSSLI